MLQLPLNVQLDDSARFDNFFAASNQQIVNRLSAYQGSAIDFIYIWGAKETGKTHLAQALCHAMNQDNQSAAYLPLDIPELIPDILEGMSTMDLVCIDNLEAVLGNRRWETALFDLYNNLKLENKGFVIMSNEAPANLPIELQDLRSRLTAMEIYRLSSLDDEEKIDFFGRRANNRGLVISPDVTRFILSRYSRSVADLIDILECLDRSTIMLQRKVTIPLVKQILE